MKRILALVVLLLLGFYVAWPAWSGYQTANALNAKDSATLDSKIIFPEVRQSLKPTVLAKIGEALERTQPGSVGGVIAANMSPQAREQLADAALERLVTAQNLIRLVHDGRGFKESAERILAEQMGGAALGGGLGGALGGKLPGGLGGLAEKMGIDPGKIGGIPGLGGNRPSGSPVQTVPANEPAAPAAQPTKYGLSNIKRFGFRGPLAFEVGVAKDQAAKEADVTVEMRFTGGDWRVVAVRPRI